MDVWDNTTTSNCGLDQSVKLFISSDGEQEMSWCDSLHLQVLRGVTGELEDFGSKVLKDSSTVDGRGGSNSAIGTDSGFQESMNSSDGEL